MGFNSGFKGLISQVHLVPTEHECLVDGTTASVFAGVPETGYVRSALLWLPTFCSENSNTVP